MENRRSDHYPVKTEAKAMADGTFTSRSRVYRKQTNNPGIIAEVAVHYETQLPSRLKEGNEATNIDELESAYKRFKGRILKP